MKKLIAFLCLLTVTVIKAQAPQYLNYQGIARDASGTIITNPIGVKFEVVQGSASGTVVYDETNTIVPGSAGIFTTAIGSGASGTGTFTAINWANGPYYLRVNIDPAGGTSYSTVGTSQLLSVPYALYAETSGNAATTYSAGTGISISSGSIINTAPDQSVSISGSAVIGSYPNYTITSPGAPTASTGISISGGTITNTAPDQTVSITGLGSTTVSGTYPSFTISTPVTSTAAAISTIQINPPHSITNLGPNNNSITIQPTNITGAGVSGAFPNYTIASSPSTSITQGPNITVTGSIPSYTVSAPAYSLTNSTGSLVLSNGISSSTVTPMQPPLNYSTSTTTSIPGGTLSLGSQSVNLNAWDLNGNAGTVPSTNYLGTFDAQALVFRTSNINRMSLNTSTLTGSGGLVIGGNVLNTSLGRALTLQGLLSTSDASDQNYGHFGIRSGNSGNAAQAFMSFNNALASRIGLLGDASTTDADIYLNATNNLRLGAGASPTNTSIYIDGSINRVGVNIVTPLLYRFHVLEATNANAAVGAINTYTTTSNASAFGLFASSANSHSISAGVYGTHSGNGVGVSGINTNNTSSTAAGVYGLVTASFSTAIGVEGYGTGFSTGVKGTSSGAGHSIYGVKPVGAGGGNAGRFEVQSTGSTGDALFAITDGMGAAIHAVNGPTVTGGSNVAVLLENGHVKTIQSVKPTIVTSTGLGSGSSCSINGNGTDIAGEILMNTGTLVGGPPYYLVQVTFNKPLTSTGSAVIILTARSPQTAGLQLFATPNGNQGFWVGTNNTPGSFTNYQLFYYVIER
jgi:hypothetical protein